MNRISLVGVVAFLFIGCSCSDDAQKPKKPDGFKEITFDAPDHHKIYADFYPSAKLNSEKVVLMFHQAGSNAGEYESIAPAICALGYNCIAVDQRSGGDMWGRTNRTVKNSGSGDYSAAYKDLQGAMEYAHTANYTTIIAWGSSYSASLVFMLADEYPEIKGVVSFSPGEYMDDKSIVKTWVSKVSAPVFFACTPDELKDGRQELYDAIHSDSKVLVSLPDGVHGSSTLIPEKSKAADDYMAKVKSFLTNLKGG